MNVFIFSACKTVPGNSELEVLYCGNDAVKGLESAKAKASGRRIWKLVNPMWVPVQVPAPAPKSPPPPSPPTQKAEEKKPTLQATTKSHLKL